MAKRIRKTAAAAGLSRERIGKTALALIDSEGLPALSARRLAELLGCEAMSLYHHVDNMGDVQDLVVDALFAQTGPKPAADPRQGLAALAAAYIDMAERHPKAFALAATRRWRTPNALAAAESAIALFMRLGLSTREALRRARILGAYMNGAGLALAAWRSGGAGAPVAAAPSAALTAEAVRADLDAGLKRLLADLC